MTEIVLKDFAVKLDLEEVKKRLQIRDENKRLGRLAEMVAMAETIARPKALYREAFVDGISGDRVNIGGTLFKSRIMRSNLERVGRVFPFAATCGSEIEGWSKSFNDVMEKYWANGIKECVLYMAIETLVAHVTNFFETGDLGIMNPGSLPDWPISEQGPLISMLGDIQSSIGITLSSAMMLIPVNSLTGILFPTETGYVNCQLCTRKNCRNRRAPFNAKLYQEKLG